MSTRRKTGTKAYIRPTLHAADAIPVVMLGHPSVGTCMNLEKCEDLGCSEWDVQTLPDPITERVEVYRRVSECNLVDTPNG